MRNHHVVHPALFTLDRRGPIDPHALAGMGQCLARDRSGVRAAGDQDVAHVVLVFSVIERPLTNGREGRRDAVGEDALAVDTASLSGPTLLVDVRDELGVGEHFVQ